MTNPIRAYRPIFILGISQRSGTNYLHDLLRKHPDSYSPGTIWEDFFIHYSDLLIQYSDSVFKRWKWKEGKVEKHVKTSLYRSLGDGLVSFLSSQGSGMRLITKTPSVVNIHNFFLLFPEAYLLVLVRDGRAVVESRVKTFSESYDSAIHRWATAAETILKFDCKNKAITPNYLIVKYEDLWNDAETELRKIFSFVGLDDQLYDFDSALNLPVRGSSVFHGNQNSQVHWKPLPRTPEFDPTKRWKHWNRFLHEKFNYIAGKQLMQLGYKEKKYITFRHFWFIWIRLLDFKYELGQSFRYIYTNMKHTVKLIVRKNTSQKSHMRN